VSGPPANSLALVRRQSRLLRAGACIEALAFPWAVLPREWMERSHIGLGMGTMPQGPVLDFMIRQSAFVYGMHAVLLWWLARDVLRYQPLVRLIGWTYLVYGPAFLLINWRTGTPLWWTLCDPLVTGGFGVWLLRNDAGISRQSSQSPRPSELEHSTAGPPAERHNSG
jgi:hypothetical protein